MTRVAKVLLVLTAFAPILLTLAFVDFLAGDYVRVAAYAIAAALLGALSALVLFEVSRRGEVVPIEVQSVRPADKEMLAFVLSYLLPLTNTANVGRMNVAVLWFVVAMLVLVVYATNAYQFNPWLGLFGYRFYEVTNQSKVTYVLITRRNIRAAAEASEVVEIAEYIVLERNHGR